MILHCSFEELRALSAGAELVLNGARAESDGGVAAPAEALAHVENLLPQLTGDLSIETLEEQRRYEEALSLICDNLRTRLDGAVVDLYPAHEEAVALYFDYAHTRSVLDRVHQMGVEMGAMIEVMTGAPPTDATAHSVTFPD